MTVFQLDHYSVFNVRIASAEKLFENFCAHFGK